MEAKIYYDNGKGGSAGPVTYAELRTHAEGRRILPHTLCGVGEDRAAWGVAQVRYPELFGGIGTEGSNQVLDASRIAGLGRRAVGWFIDAALCGVAAFVLLETIVGPFIILIGYPIALLAANGQTLGMQACKLKLVTVDGQRPTITMIVIRTLVRWFSLAFPPLYLVALFSKKKQALHDLAAKTIVVKEGA